MAFEVGCKITMGAVFADTCIALKINKSIFSYKDTALITLPAKNFPYANAKAGNFKQSNNTASYVKAGDKVRIELAYDNSYAVEFVGFVARTENNEDKLTCNIICEGYSYQLRYVRLTKFWAKTTLKEVLTEAVKGTDIKLQVSADVPLVNIMADKVNALAFIDELLSDVLKGYITAYFIKPDTLYVGLRYGGVKPFETNYSNGYNTIRSDFDVKEKPETKVNIEIVHNKKDGKRIKAKVNNVGVKEKKVILQNVESASWLQKLAEEANRKYNYEVYKGKIIAMLEPYAEPGAKMNYKNELFPEWSGSYIIDDMELTMNGAGVRRAITVSHKIGFSDNAKTAAITETWADNE